MKEGTLKIHTENILPIIKKWLYSDKDIFIRELVSNACDACTKLKKIEELDDFRIDIRIDKEKKQLIFADNGIGMSSEEVETYIAQIAFSGAEEFLKKYETNKEEDQVIGHFGLGFYSSYMVAQTVEIETKSYTDAPAVSWRSDGAATYTLEEGMRQERGTDITLNLMEEEEEYLDEAKIRKILTHYCAFLPYPIYLNDKQINEQEPLWMRAPSACTDKEYLDFYHHLFPFEPDPLFWVHLNVDYPFHLKGILYFPKLTAENDLRKETIKLFCNRVFVSDNCKDLLPDYLMILRGAIDSPDIPLNVSRSYLQMDRTVRQLGSHISKKISDRLTALYRSEKDKFLSYWPDIELIIKYGAIQDEKFYERVKEFLVWKNNKEEWTNVEEYLERHDRETVYYAPQKEAHMLSLFEGQEVLFVQQTPIDQAMLHHLEQKTKAKFKRIDGAIDEAILDRENEKTLLDSEGKSESARIADFFRKHLETEVEAKSLTSNSLPAFLMIKEEERRMRDSLAFQKQMPLNDLIKPTLVVNTNSKLINAIFKLETSDPKLADEMAKGILDLAKLSQREMEPDALAGFVARHTEILEKLAEKVKG